MDQYPTEEEEFELRYQDELEMLQEDEDDGNNCYMSIKGHKYVFTTFFCLVQQIVHEIIYFRTMNTP